MIRALTLAVLLALPSAVSAQAGPAAAPSARTEKTFQVIDPSQVRPTQMLPAPPAAGSRAETLELDHLRALIKAADAERMERAKWDDEHEDPSIFDGVLGTSLKAHPAAWALMLTIQNDADLAGNLAKKHFARIRPWGVDPKLPNCDAGKGKTPLGSYPSGHSVLGYSVGFALAQLVPDKAQAILDRAADYALSREICGVHFPSDTEASHVIGTRVAALILADPRMQARVAAARAELAAPGSR